MPDEKVKPAASSKAAETRKAERQARRAQALRDNLKRRKEQDRARKPPARAAD